MRLAVDVMGGDNAPDDILRGCIDGLKHLAPDDKLVLFGNERDIDEVLSEVGVSDPRIEIVATTQVIEMAESPSLAVKGKPDSSIVQHRRVRGCGHHADEAAAGHPPPGDFRGHAQHARPDGALRCRRQS